MLNAVTDQIGKVKFTWMLRGKADRTGNNVIMVVRQAAGAIAWLAENYTYFKHVIVITLNIIHSIAKS